MNKEKIVSLSSKKQNIFSDLAKNYELLLLCIPALLLFLLFNYIPMAGLFIAFKNIRYDLGIWASEWVGFKNFEFFFLSQDAWRITRNTIGYNAMFIISGLVVSIILALLLNEITKRVFVKVYQTVMFIPYFLSWVVVGYMLYSFINGSHGILNSLLNALGFDSIQWYVKAGYWPYILILAALWKNAGYHCIIFYAGIMSVDSEIYEAASIDGASKIQKMSRITIPMLVPLIIVITLLSVGKIFYADFGLFYHLPRQSTNGLLFSTTDVIDTYVFRSLRQIGDIGMASAAGLFQSVCGFILVVLSNFAVGKANKDYRIY